MKLRFFFASMLVLYGLFGIPVWAATGPTKSDRAPSTCSGLIENTEENFSPEARRFLALMDLGLQALDQDRVKFVTNLREAAQADYPMNPYLNLTSPQGFALSGQTELLIGELSTDWPRIAKLIGFRFHSAAEAENMRQQDVVGTSLVPGFAKLRFDNGHSVFGQVLRKWPFPQFIMQTQDHLIVAGLLPAGQKNFHETGVYKISKIGGQISLLAKLVMEARNSIQVWDRDGQIYGFGLPSSGSGHRVFRLDPETGAIQWSNVRSDTSKSIHRIPGTTELVGVYFSEYAPNGRIACPMDGAKGEILRFDYAALDVMMAGGIEFSISPSDCAPYNHSKAGFPSSLVDSRDPDPWLRLGSLMKTDGVRVAHPSDAANWLAMTPIDGLKVTFVNHDKRVKNRPVAIHIVEATAHYADKDPFKAPIQKPVPGAKTVEVWFQYRKGWLPKFRCETIQTKGQLLCYVMNLDQKTAELTEVDGLWLLDQQSFSMTSVEIKNKPQHEGTWTFIKNNRHQQLLQFVSSDKLTAGLWRLEESAGSFEEVFQETLDDHTIKSANGPLVDHDALALIGWTTDDRLVLKVMYSISRDRPSLDPK